MTSFAVFLAICFLASAQARPGYSGDHHHLHAVPDASHYGHLHYGKFGIIPLGSAIKNNLPPAVVTITKEITHKIPHPYPVKIPVPHPVPVPIAKPYPVVETKIIKVPHPYPVEVIKKVAVPYEVPKPYPVHQEESGSGGGGSFGGGSFGGHEQIGGYQKLEEGGEEGGYGGGFEGGDQSGGYSEADQSGAYDTQVQAQQAGWVPVQMQHGEQQQAEEQH